MRVAVLQGGRSLERQVSLRSGARVQDALERLGHEVVAIDAGPDLVARLRGAAPDVAFVALHGRDGEDGTVQELLEALGIPYTGSGVAACMRSLDKVTAKHLLRDAGVATPDWFSFTETAFKELGASDALGAIEERLAFPIVVKPADQGSALGIRFARTPADVPGALVAAFSYSPQGPARAPRARARARGGAARRRGAAGRRGRSRATRTSTTSAPATRSGARASSARPTWAPAGTAAAQALAVEVRRLLGLEGFARVDLMLEEGTGELLVLEANAVPGPDRHEPRPPGGRGRGAGLRGLRRPRAGPGAGAGGAGGRRALSAGASRCRPRSPRARPGRGTP